MKRINSFNDINKMVQRKYVDDDWKFMCCCIFLNSTRTRAAREIIGNFFKVYDSPQKFINENSDEKILSIVRSLGLVNKRLKNLRGFTRDYLKGKNIYECFGIGKYAIHSYEIFVNNNLKINPKSKILIGYLEWIKENKKD